MKVSTIGLDIAKSIFQIHGVDETGEVVLTRRFTRGHVRQAGVNSLVA